MKGSWTGRFAKAAFATLALGFATAFLAAVVWMVQQAFSHNIGRGTH